jgi:hypothetical protein
VKDTASSGFSQWPGLPLDVVLVGVARFLPGPSPPAALSPGAVPLLQFQPRQGTGNPNIARETLRSTAQPSFPELSKRDALSSSAPPALSAMIDSATKAAAGQRCATLPRRALDRLYGGENFREVRDRGREADAVPSGREAPVIVAADALAILRNPRTLAAVGCGHRGRAPRRAVNVRRRGSRRRTSPRCDSDGDGDGEPKPGGTRREYPLEIQKWGGTASTARPRHRGASLGATGRLTACPSRPVAPLEQKERHEDHHRVGFP